MNGDGSEGQSGTRCWRAVRWAASTGFVVCFGVFSVNVLFGSLAMSQGWSNPLSLDRLTEFFVLFGSAVFLTLAALASEAEGRATRHREAQD